MRCEVVAVGTELLLGQIVDTNSAWLGARLASAGIHSHFQTRVGDNQGRIAGALRTALGRGEAAILCGGLGPTPDDITREAIAEVMDVPLVRDQAIVESTRARFSAAGKTMAPGNERLGDVPQGSRVIPPTIGTAPGLICPVQERVVYAVPGVPAEMEEMVERAVIPDLRARTGPGPTIVSRVVRTWGLAESTLADMVAPRLEALDDAANPTIAFLAVDAQGVLVRITARAEDEEAAKALLDAEEDELRRLLGTAVVGVDDQSMEHVVGSLLEERGLSLGLAESMTGGLVASRLAGVAGASAWLRGSVVAYASEVKAGVLGVGHRPVVSDEAARGMAVAARRVLGAGVGLSVTGVAGPDEQDGMPVGTTFVGLSLEDGTEVARLRLSGTRERIRQHATLSALDLLRRRLLGTGGPR